MLPQLNQKEERKSVIVSQKTIHSGQMFAALHNGNSTLALDDKFGIKFTSLGNKMVSVELVRYGINAVARTNVTFRPKVKKVVPKKKLPITKKLKMEDKIKTGELL